MKVTHPKSRGWKTVHLGVYLKRRGSKARRLTLTGSCRRFVESSNQFMTHHFKDEETMT